MSDQTAGFDLLSVVPAGLTFTGGIVVAWIGSLVNRRNSKDTTKQASRRDTLADRDALIATLSTRMDQLQGRVDSMETEVREVHTHNLSLVNFILRCINVFQQHGLENEIPKPLPKGVEL